MSTSSDRRIPETKGQDLIDVVFSWSIEDVLNKGFYRGKVRKIPETFSSATCYTNSFIEPLCEETHAQLLSKMKSISDASTLKVIGISKTKDYKLPKDYVYSISFGSNKTDKGSFEPEVGDLIALTNRKPRCAEDLNPYIIAVVQRITPEDPHRVQILSSKPIMFFEKLMFFVIHLVNLTSNIRIWKALHFKLDGKNTKIIDKVLRSDSNVTCSLCSIEDAKKSASPGLQEAIGTLNLNTSQETAVWSCISARECRHQETLKLIWGPPGTGKTKTVCCLLFALWKTKCRTLTCAPTNNAVLEVAARLVTSSLGDDSYGLGDIVLFGNSKRMKLEKFQELNQVFLENRISVLAGCLSPQCGWRSKAESMIRLLKYPKAEYNSYLLVGKEEDEDSENEAYEIRDVTLNVRGRDGNEIVWKEKVLKKTKNKDVVLWSFAEFMTKRFKVLEEKLVTMVTNMYTHMPTSFVNLQQSKKMMRIIYLIRSIGSLLPIRNGVEISDGKVTTLIEIQEMKTEFLKVLKEVLHETVSFPKLTGDQEIRNFCLENACLIFCTASSTVRLHALNKNVEVLVVDEAAQLKECESVISLQLSGLRQAILIGDEKQLPATVQSNLCAKMEFGRSLFERLTSLKYVTHLLNVQYRMHPTISSFPNREFYGKRIRNGPNVKKGTYTKRFLEGDMFGSYSFIHLTNGKVELDETQSGKNMIEVAVIVELVAKLHTECVEKNRKISVGCITPYKAQVSAIQSKLGDTYRTGEAGQCEFSVNVRTVDGFQGCEEDVIIISTVTGIGNRPMGFFSTDQRVNVALTRARHCLWILGNGDTLMKTGPVWRRLVLDAKARHCYHVANEDETLARVITNTMVKLGQFEGLLDMNSLLFKEAKWKVMFGNDFLKSIGDIKNPETCKQVHSLLLKLSSGWRVIRPGNVSHVSMLFEVSNVNFQGLRLIWSVDIVEENTQIIQVLKVWDVLQGTSKLGELIKCINKFYGDYSDETLNHCKEKRKEGNLEVPKIWSNVDENGCLSSRIGAISLRREAGSSS